MGVMFFAGGVGDWRTLSNINDPPPQAMKAVVGESSSWLHMLVWIGLFGLVASFHGIILGYSRQFFALARAGYLPASLAKLSRFQTPHRAIIAGGVIGIAAIYSDGLINLGGMTLTAAMITMAVFGATVMYIMSMLSLFKLRKTEPGTHFPRALLPVAAIHCAGVGGGLPGGDGLLQHLDRVDLPRLHGSGFRVLHADRATACRCAGGCDVDRALNSRSAAVGSGIEWNHCEIPSLKSGMQDRLAKPLSTGLPLRRTPMPWYAWLILIVAIGSIVGGLMMLRDTANKVELTEEQRKRVAERNAEADAKDAQDR